MNKRIIAMALAPLAIAVIALAIIGSGSSEARQTPPPSAPAVVTSQEVCENGAGAAGEQCGYPVFECFWILKAEGEGAYPDDRIKLTTQSYGSDDVLVQRIAWLCESGYKYRAFDQGPAGDVEVQVNGTKVFACYYIALGDVVFQTEGVYTDNFGLDRVFVTKSGVMCERAEKYHNNTVTGSLVEDEADAQGVNGRHWQCFTLYAAPRLRPFGIWTNNFNWQAIWAMNGYQLCENAEKQHYEYVGGSANGYMRECFRIEQMNQWWIPQWVTLNTNNFGEVDVLVGRPMLMCENAWWQKEP